MHSCLHFSWSYPRESNSFLSPMGPRDWTEAYFCPIAPIAPAAFIISPGTYSAGRIGKARSPPRPRTECTLGELDGTGRARSLRSASRGTWTHAAMRNLFGQLESMRSPAILRVLHAPCVQTDFVNGRSPSRAGALGTWGGESQAEQPERNAKWKAVNQCCVVDHNDRPVTHPERQSRRRQKFMIDPSCSTLRTLPPIYAWLRNFYRFARLRQVRSISCHVE